MEPPNPERRHVGMRRAARLDARARKRATSNGATPDVPRSRSLVDGEYGVSSPSAYAWRGRRAR